MVTSWGSAPIVDRQHLKNGRMVVETDANGIAWELQRLDRQPSALGQTSLYKVLGEYVKKERKKREKKLSPLAMLAKEFA